MKKIALVKRHDLLREAIIKILQEKESIQTVTPYCEEDYDLLYQPMNLLPDLLIIDLNTDIDVFKLIDFYIMQDVKVIVCCSVTDDYRLTDLFKLGLHGYFHNDMEISELVYAIQSILDGEKYIHQKLSHVLLNNYMKLTREGPRKPKGNLTKREWEVLELIVNGEKNCSIGDKLFISVKTVTNHVASILRKLNVPNRTNAALFAVKQRWFIL